jgi:hypothetical protein
MTYRKLGRRDFMRGVTASAAMLPMLSALDARAQADDYPRRLLLVFSPNGTIYENWRPSGGETDFQLSSILAPLESLRDKIIVLDEIDNECAHHGPGDGHMTGMGTLWTATELLEGTQFECGGTDPCSGWGGGISIDQLVAEALQARLPTQERPRFKSLELAVQAGGADVWSRMSYAGADQPIAPMEDPYQVFDRLFADLNLDEAVLQRRLRMRRSVLDYVSGSLGRLAGRLGGEDRDKLEAHLSAVRDIEMQLAAGQDNCAVPEVPQGLEFWNNDQFPQVLRAQSDLLVRALACNLTQVATLQWSRSVGGQRFGWLPEPIPEGHHDLSHNGDSDAEAMDKITRINTWYAEQFAYLLQQLDSVPEGSGTLLDHTLVVWGNELGRGNSHSRRKIPFIIAGGGGGAFPTGRFLSYGGESHTKLLISIAQAMGVETDTFGNPAYGTGPLPRLAG